MINRESALVLSGGGAYGAYEVGLMKAILGGETIATDYKPIEPGIFTGTSVGAVNAAIMVSRSHTPVSAALEYLEETWLNEFAEGPGQLGNGAFRVRLNPLEYSNVASLARQPGKPLRDLADDAMVLGRTFLQRGADFMLSTGALESRAVKVVDLSAFISSTPMRDTIRRVVDLEKIQSSDRILQVAATNWSTGATVLFGNQDFTAADGHAILQGSAAIPGIFAPVTVGDATYADGGLVINTPLSPAIHEGATTLHVIYLDPKVQNIPLMRLQNTLEVLERSLAIAFAARANMDIENLKWINESLAALEKTEGEPDNALRALARTVSRLEKRGGEVPKYQKLTVHRYHPHEDLGDGFGILDFSLGSIEKNILRGFDDGVRHSCKESGCILPK